MPSKPELALAMQLRTLAAVTPTLPLADYKTEYRFAPPRRWRFDFAWPSLLLAVEVEGGTWVQGRHGRGAGFEADCEKYAAALLGGWRVLRVTPAQIKSGQAITWIEALMRAEGEIEE